MLSDDEKAARAEVRRIAVEKRKEEKRQEREARSAANKAAWASDPRNVNYVRAEAKAAAVPLPIEADAPADNGALGRLRAIMADAEQPLYRRVEAAETVLKYELAPAALASGPGTGEVAAGSLRFLRAVVDLPDTPDPMRLRALCCVAAIENARAARIDRDQAAVKRETWIAMVNAERRRTMIETGAWPPADVGWCLTLADVLNREPEGSGPWPPGDIGGLFDAAKLRPQARRDADREASRAKLRSVRATNRTDDWRAGITPS